MTTFLLPFRNRCLILPSISCLISSQRYNYKMTLVSDTQCKKRPDTQMLIKRNAISLANTFEKLKNKQKLKLNGVLLYEDIVDKLNYNSFYQEFEMEDTLFSWFLVTEMHIWMIALRIMQDEEHGVALRNHLIEAMWKDVRIRAKKLGVSNTSVLNNQLTLLSQQFNASFLGYDEAILSDDTLLANHLWNRFFKCKVDDPQKMARLIEYIRQQVHYLSITPSTDIFAIPPSIRWINS